METFVTNEGYWGNVTATLDWCEENYVVCDVIAEFWNTISNITFLCLSLVGLYCCRRYNLENRFLFSHMSLFVVGIGSWCFHATLLYEMQLLDELPMIYGSFFVFYAIFKNDDKKNFVQGHQFLVAISAAMAVFITVAYLHNKNPIFHESAYAILVLAIVYSSVEKGYRSKLPFARTVLYTGLSTYLLGFILWNVDNVFCKHLKDIRNHIGAPYDTIFQLHAWWHLLTGIGTYLQILLSTAVRYESKGFAKDMKIRFVGLVPYLHFDRLPSKRKLHSQ